jgi:tetratricopeptide (TPR) repeat protein
VADAYSELGEFEKAAGLLESSSDAAGVARLAALRRRQGDPQAAAALYQRLLQARDADAPMLIEAAEFFADRGDGAMAQQFITKLATLPLKPGALEIIRGRFQERRGKPDEALAAYRAATAVEGAGINAWHELAGFLLRQHRFAEAGGAATEGLKATPRGNDEWLAALRLRANALQAVPEADASRARTDDPSVDALLAALSANPSDEAAVQMLELLSKVTAPVLDNVKPVADRFPQFIPLQYRAVRLALEARQLTAAEQLARRAARYRPDDPEAARLVAATLVAQREWAKAKPAALAWRALAWNNPLPADLLAAECEIESGDPGPAAERLKGYVSGAARDDVRVNAVQARALISSASADEAAALLEARAAREPTWRAAWLSLATAHRDASAASAWIERIAPRVSETSPAERKALAEAWFAAGQRFGAADAYRRAFDVIKAVPAASLDGDGQAVLALCAQAVGDYDAAVAAHRAVLAGNPQMPEARNNLAYALMLRGKTEDLSEAKRLADEAVAARPDNATFRDTLARVDVRAGNLDAGTAEFRAALRSEPYHVEARLGLADVLASTRQHEEGRILLASLEKDLRLAPAALPAHLTGQLESVRRALAKR